MRELFSIIFDKLTDPLGLPIAVWKEWLILFILRKLAYVTAFRAVGQIYKSGDISTGIGGSFFHWPIRLIVFVAIWAIAYGAIRAYKFCAAHWMVVAGILGSLLVLRSIGFIIYHNIKGGT